MRSHDRRLRLARVATVALLAAPLALVGCSEEPQGRQETGLEALTLDDVNPKIIVPGSRLSIDGSSFLDRPLGVSWLRLQGGYGGAPIDAYLPAEFVDFDRMRINATPDILRLIGPSTGTFVGQVQVEVDFVPDGTRQVSIARTMELQILDHLEPQLDEVAAASVIFANEPIEVRGSGLLLGGDEGTTYAIVEGCVRSLGSDACEPITPVEIPVVPADSGLRDLGVFPFSPRIAGITAGNFEGTVTLRNEHADGEIRESTAQQVAYELTETVVTAVGDGEAATLGRYVTVDGGGFVSRDDGGLTSLVLDGTYFPDSGGEAPVSLQVIPDFVDGRQVRYVINEEDTLAQAIDIRQARGTFVGQIQPVVEFEDQQVEGAPAELTFRLEPVKQVVVVQFNASYTESLRLFGLRALDQQIRERVLTVLARDYEAINVEFVTETPTDYKLYSVVEIAGPDPNGLGLLGYDNTPGKDRDNVRLDDRIGGVNAQTLESGLPGFGGVFMESLFSFSFHPPAGTVGSADVATESFDQIFDPLRPDRGGQAVTSADFAGGAVPVLSSGATCPATARADRIACAVFVLGSVVGSTVSHEVGHSLGLAEPLGSLEEFHNKGDLAGRLMDAGSARSFEERAELMGEGPSRFCVESYEYLRGILPTTDLDPPVSRPPC